VIFMAPAAALSVVKPSKCTAARPYLGFGNVELVQVNRPGRIPP
jgi:hypothetical protein